MPVHPGDCEASSQKLELGILLELKSKSTWTAETDVGEVAVDADAVDAGRWLAEVDLALAAFASEAGGAIAAEIVDQIGAVGAEETGPVGAVVDHLVAELALPSGRTDALEAAALQRQTLGPVLTRIVGAWIQRAGAVGARVAAAAEAGQVARTRFVLAHGVVVARAFLTRFHPTAGFLFLALEAGIAFRTGAGVALIMTHVMVTGHGLFWSMDGWMDGWSLPGRNLGTFRRCNTDGKHNHRRRSRRSGR